MDLRSTQLKDTYGNLLTIGTSAGSPTSGTLQNGDGEDISILTIGNSTSTNHRLILQDSTTSARILITSGDFYIDGDIDGGNNRDIVFTVDGGDESMRLESNGDISFQDTSNNEAFYWDADVARLGIGTASPSVPLEVNVSGAGDVFKLTRDTGTNGELNIDFAGANANFASAQGGYTFTTSSVSSAMTIASSGNVGIGVSPAEKLDIVADSVSGLKIGTNSAGGATLTTYQGSTNSNVRQFEINCQNFEVNTGLPTGTSTSTAMTIDSSGNVGISETNPTAPLQIKTATSAGNPKVAQFLTHANTTSGTEVRLAFAAHTNVDIASDRYSYISALNTSGSNGQALVFATNAAGAGGSERMRIDSSGKVLMKSTFNFDYGALELLNLHGDGGNQGSTTLTFSVQNSIAVKARSTIKSEERSGDSNLTNLIFSVSDNNAGNPAEAFRLTGGGSAGDATFLRMASGTGGIQFNGDTATANALDDYEEGTFTPAFNNVTVTYTSQSGKYTKIGRLVQAEYVINVATIDTTDSSVINLNLPFNAVGNSIILGQVGMGESSLMDSSATPSGFSSSGAGTAVNLSNGTTVYRYNNLTNTSGLFYLSIVYTAS